MRKFSVRVTRVRMKHSGENAYYVLEPGHGDSLKGYYAKKSEVCAHTLMDLEVRLANNATNNVACTGML